MQVFLPNPDYDYTEYVAGVEPYVCTTPVDTAEMKITTEVRLGIISDKCIDTTVSPWQVRDSESDAMVQSEARRHYVLAGHSPAFDCGPDFYGRTFVEEEAATFHLLTNGSLRGSFPGQNVSRVQVWERAQYCLLIGAVPDFSYTYSDYGTNTSAATYSNNSEGGSFSICQPFMNCLEHEKLTWEQQFNTRLSIS